MSEPDDRVKALYPFLDDGRAAERRPAEAGAARPAAGGGDESGLLDSVRGKAAHSVAVKQAFFDAHADDVVAAAKAMAGVYRRGGRMFAMGNGGSSCDAAHFTVEFVHPVTAGRPALPAVNLTADVAASSAVANDVGWEHVFVRQIIALGTPGDGLIGFSTSGSSANLLAAFRTAKARGLVTIGLAGGDGGEMASSGTVDHCLTVPTDSVHRVQETHVAIYHVLWDLVHTLLADHRHTGNHERGE